VSVIDNIAVQAPDHKRYFIEKLGLSERLMERCLGEALSAGGEYADLYFESVTSTALGIDESLVKTASQSISVGCGIRVLSGERTGYAYTDDLSSERLLRAARTAALIANGSTRERVAGFQHAAGAATLYPIAGAANDAEIAAKLELIQRADRAAREYDTRITQVRAGFNDELRRILIAASDGTFASDTQPLARLNIFVIAKDASARAARRAGHRAAADEWRWSSSRGNIRQSTLRARLRGRRSCNSTRLRPLRARCRWCWGRDGQEFYCTRPSDTGWRPTSIARRPRRLRG